MVRKLLLLLLLVCSLWAQNPNTAAFPAAVADDEDLLVQSNQGQTTLNGGIDDSTLTIVLTDASKFNTPGVITIDYEWIKICSKVTNTLTACSGGRGWQSSTAVSHSSGANVNAYLTAWEHNQLAKEMQAVQAKLPTGTTPPFWKNESSGTMAARNSGDTDYAPIVGSSIDTGSGGSVGGMVSLGQGTLATPPANSVSLSAPTSVPTAYTLTFPSAIAAGLLSTGATGTISFTPTPVLGTAGSVVGTLGFANATSGAITLQPTTGALGTTAITLPAATGTAAVAATSTTATQALFATTTAGAPEYRAIAVADLPTTTKTRVFGCVFDGGGSTVTQDSKCYMRLPVAGTIVGWSVVAVGTSPTCTIDVWKVASGTALPTVSDALTGAGDTHPALATGNALKSTDLTGWGSTTITADDIAGFNVDAISAATWIEVLIYYTES